MLDGQSISLVLDVLRPERAALLDLLKGLTAEDWSRPTECPAYSIKGVANHILGDDLSLLSRQRDGAQPGTLQVAAELGGVDFRTVLDTFNDRWVTAAAFLSTELVVELLRLTGEWTAVYYEAVDPDAPGEAVGLFGDWGQASPFWKAIAREYMERWIHHSQIRRALGLPSLADEPFVRVGVEVAAAIARSDPTLPEEPDGSWAIGALELGSAQQAADILSRGHTVEEVRALVSGPDDAVELIAAVAGRS